MEQNESFEKIKEKIIKILAIADDPNASDNEVYVAVKKAQKMMVEYNISKDEIYERKQTVDDVVSYDFETLHPMMYSTIFSVVSRNFRCVCTYVKYRQKAEFRICGLDEDVEIAKQVLLKIFGYLKIKLKSYAKHHREKTSELYSVLGVRANDARVVKKSYCYGFSDGLSEQFKKNMIELEEEYSSSTALVVTSVPEVVNDYVNEKIKPKKVTLKRQNIDSMAFNDGYSDGKRFNV